MEDDYQGILGGGLLSRRNDNGNAVRHDYSLLESTPDTLIHPVQVASPCLDFQP